MKYYVWHESRKKGLMGMPSVFLGEISSGFSEFKDLETALGYMENDPCWSCEGEWETKFRLFKGEELSFKREEIVTEREETVTIKDTKIKYKLKG